MAAGGRSPSPAAAIDPTTRSWPTRLLRWAIKLLGLLVLAYYFLPPKVFGVPVFWAIPLGALVVAAIEAARWRWGFSLPTLRAYERTRVASYVYWAASLGTLVAFFPEGVAVAALGAAAASDIGISAWREAGAPRLPGRVAVGWTIFAVVSIPLLASLSPEGVPAAAFLGVAGGALAVAVEGRRWPGLDDDLLMPLLPALLWLALSQVVPGGSPLGFHAPWVSRG